MLPSVKRLAIAILIVVVAALVLFDLSFVIRD